MMEWVPEHWLWFAFLFTIFWGIYGWKYIEEKKEYKDKRLIEKVGDFLSEFIGSFAGWCCFYILTVRLHEPFDKIGGVDIFLIISAIVGMAGYSYRIVELIETYLKCKQQ